jgi:hypothetical protein
MIDETLKYIVTELNRFFKNRFNVNENLAVVSGLVNMDGTPALQQDNRIVVTLLNVEQEKVTASVGNYSQSGSVASAVSPPVYLNLYVLFSGYFPGSNYTEALKFISGVILFFQSNVSLSRDSSPGLPDTVDKLIFDLQKFSYQELSHIWGMLGAKHMPSVVYRMRMIVIDGQKVREQRPSVSGVSPSLE